MVRDHEFYLGVLSLKWLLYNDWFLKVEPALHFQNKPHLVVIYYLFYILLDSRGNAR